MSFRVVLAPRRRPIWTTPQLGTKSGRLDWGFVEAVSHAIDALSANPLLTSRRHRRRNIRWVYPPRFPYRIIYEVANDTVTVISVLHAARHDRHWRDRLPEGRS